MENDKVIQSLNDQLEIADIEHEDFVISLKTTASSTQTERVKLMCDPASVLELRLSCRSKVFTFETNPKLKKYGINVWVVA